jgi:glycosyltransferase involved in cell wall biosynthesis
MNKILFLAPANSIHSHKWIDYFTRDFEVRWISFNVPFSQELVEKKYQKNIKLIKYLKYNLYNFFLIYLQVLWIAIKFKPNIIHIHSANKYLILSLILFPFYKKIILTIWGSDYIYNQDKFIFKIIFKIILKKIILLTTDANHLAENIIEKYNFKKIKIINFGLNNYFLKESKNYNLINNQIRQAVILEKKKKNLIIYTNRSYDKISDIKVILKSFYKLCSVYSNVSLIMTGSGPQFDELININKKKNFIKKIYIFGRVNLPTLAYLYKNAEIYISASRSDAGISSSVCEAMFFGNKCIIADNSDNKLWVKNFHNGFLFKTGNVNDLFNKLKFTIDNKKKYFKNLKEFNKNKLKSNNFAIEMNKMKREYLKYV